VVSSVQLLDVVDWGVQVSAATSCGVHISGSTGSGVHPTFFPTADTTAKPSAFPVKLAVAARIPEAVEVP
jgi:hypothetical protein